MENLKNNFIDMDEIMNDSKNTLHDIHVQVAKLNEKLQFVKENINALHELLSIKQSSMQRPIEDLVSIVLLNQHSQIVKQENSKNLIVDIIIINNITSVNT